MVGVAKHDQRAAFGEFGVDADAAGARAIGGDFQRRAHDLVEVGFRLRGRMQAYHAEEALDDAAATFGRRPHFLGARLGLRVGGKLMQQRRLGDDDGERVVELVRNACEQRTHRRHLLILVQLLALAVDLVLSLPSLAQVADRAQEDAPVGDLHLIGRKLDREDLARGVLRDSLHAAPKHRRPAPGHVLAAVGEAFAVVVRDDGVEQVLADDVGLGEAVHLFGSRD